MANVVRGEMLFRNDETTNLPHIHAVAWQPLLLSPSLFPTAFGIPTGPVEIQSTSVAMGSDGLRTEPIGVQTSPTPAAMGSSPTASDLESSPASDPKQRTVIDKRKNLSFCCTLDELEKACNSKGDEGAQIKQYMNFLTYTIYVNLVMTGWWLLGWVPHIASTLPKLYNDGFGEGFGSFEALSESLFLSTYQPSSDHYWTAMVVLGSLTMIASGPLVSFLPSSLYLLLPPYPPAYPTRSTKHKTQKRQIYSGATIIERGPLVSPRSSPPLLFLPSS